MFEFLRNLIGRGGTTKPARPETRKSSAKVPSEHASTASTGQPAAKKFGQKPKTVFAKTPAKAVKKRSRH